MKKFFSKTKEYIPIYSLSVFGLTIISGIFFVIVINSVAFADFFNYYLSAPTRLFMTYLTVTFPLSVAEIVIYLLPILLGILIFFAVKMGRKGKKASIKYFTVILSIPCLIFVTFVWTYSSGYHMSKIEDKMGLDREGVNKEALYDSYKIIVNELNDLADEIEYDETGASVMPYSYDEMSNRICKAYERFTEKHPVLQTFPSRIKPIIASEPMTYTHLSGIYSFMSGEANVNVNYPDFIIATSSAHEMAHQRGIAREDECNFIAFAVLLESDDPFLRYSAYLDVFPNILNALYSADKSLPSKVPVDKRVLGDRKSYSEFFKKYEDSLASEITNNINDSYLQANGQEQGTKAYGMIAELVCAYLLNLTK